MHFWSEKDIEREPVGWFCFEQACEFNTLPEIFVRFIQQHLNKAVCCKDSLSQIQIIFEKEEDEHRDIDPEISNWLETVCAMKPEEGELENIYFPRLWREYKKQTGHCFSCGELLNYNGPCHFYKIDFIILEEMTHFGNAWNNWGNSIFISNSIPTITSRGETDTKFQSEIYTQCIAIGEPMAFLPLTINQCNITRAEGRITEPPDPGIPAENMEQPDHPSTLRGSSQNPGMQKPKNQDDSSAGRAMLEKDFLYFGRELQIELPWIETTSPPTHDDL